MAIIEEDAIDLSPQSTMSTVEPILSFIPIYSKEDKYLSVTLS
jgi:hypothetical protein